MADLHIVGGGLAGLATAVWATAPGGDTPWRRIVLHEAAAGFGGRCRTYLDRRLGRRIDNGNHLLAGANEAAFAYLRQTGGLSGIHPLSPPRLPFMDIASGRRWMLGLRGLATRLVCDGRGALNLLRAPADATVADCLTGVSPRAVTKFWRPLTVAVVNAPPERAAARLLGGVLRETALAGPAAMRPWLATRGLGDALVEPALATLAARGVEVRRARLRALDRDGGRVGALCFTDGSTPLGEGDVVVLALPLALAARLLPDLDPPGGEDAIVNLHFASDEAKRLPPVLGLIGGTAEWAFRRPGLVSVTISAANAVAERPHDELARAVWHDLATAGGLDRTLPPWRVVVEARATPAQTPGYETWRRGLPGMVRGNLVLAGDWTEPGLPATIEAAIRSGRRAAADAAVASRGLDSARDRA